MSDKWEVVEEVQGELQGELLRGLLEAQDIPVRLNQEGAGRVYGFSVGPLGQVQILVPSSFVENAKKVLIDYYSGEYKISHNEENNTVEDEDNE